MNDCLECGVVINSKDRRRKFCSHSCSATYNNRIKGNISLRDCPGPCSKKVQGSSKSTYCSKECRKIHKIEQWHRNEWIPKGDFPKWLRDVLVAGGCSQCHWNEYNPYTGRPACQIDHVNGDSENNRYDNIRVLCPNCHSLTPTYGILNKGRGRKRRYANVAQSVERDLAKVEAVGS